MQQNNIYVSSDYDQQSNSAHVHDLSPSDELAGAVALVCILLPFSLLFFPLTFYIEILLVQRSRWATKTSI